MSQWPKPKRYLAHFTGPAMWRSLRPIDTPVVEPQNKFAVARAPTVPDGIEVQVPVKHEFIETSEREKFNGK